MGLMVEGPSLVVTLRLGDNEDVVVVGRRSERERSCLGGLEGKEGFFVWFAQ